VGRKPDRLSGVDGDISKGEWDERGEEIRIVAVLITEHGKMEIRRMRMKGQHPASEGQPSIPETGGRSESFQLITRGRRSWNRLLKCNLRKG